MPLDEPGTMRIPSRIFRGDSTRTVPVSYYSYENMERTVTFGSDGVLLSKIEQVIGDGIGLVTETTGILKCLMPVVYCRLDGDVYRVV